MKPESTPTKQGLEGTPSRLATFALSMFAVYCLLLAVLHAVGGDHDPTINFVSEYQLGPFGWLLTLALASLALGGAALLAALHRSPVGLPGGTASLVAVWTGMTIVGAVFHVDPLQIAFAEEGPPAFTASGWVHALAGGVGALCLMAAMLRLSLTWVRVIPRPPVRVAMLALSLAAPATYLAMLLTRPGTFPAGLYQRAHLVTVAAWLLIVAAAARSGVFHRVQVE